MKFLLPTKKTIGLEIKDYVIRYADSKKGLAAPLVDEVYLPKGIIEQGVIVDPQAFEVILRNCVNKWGLKNKLVHFLVPDSYVVVRKQWIPSDVTDEEIRGYIFFELGRTIHLPFDQPTIDYVVLGEKEDKREILLFAAPEDVVVSYAEMLKRVKVKPISADLSSLAFFSLYRYMQQVTKEEEMLLVKLDLFDANLTIFQDGAPVFMQTQNVMVEGAIEVADEGVFVHDRTAIMLQIDELLEEIDRILHFYQYSFGQGSREIQKIMLIGDHPLRQELQSIIESRFSFPVEHLDITDELSPKYYPALGLSLKGV
ncbi:type IV pilus biogenesis protein PilM [Ectobacillus antri]|uniref:type IV pilus biogenesis protein PilM n=1 Tax=Ectobacillus antri TaxID=2486280 RepID=UPI000F5AD766|nr:pilus assembly protein PilM [Ectobacillus antri]